MSIYLWKNNEFINDFKKTLTTENISLINIATAYISLNGTQHLKEAINKLNLDKTDIQIYCSSSFNDQEPGRILKLLSTFSTVYIVNEPFLHSKVYEIHKSDSITTYSGSANLTEGGLSNNRELMVKHITDESSLSEFWDILWQECVVVNNEVINLYEDYPVYTPSEPTHKATLKLKKRLSIIYEEQCIESHYPELTGFFFDESDYSVFNKKYWEDSSTSIKLKRKATQDKFHELNEAIKSFANSHDLHPHYKKENLTSGIDPSIYNFGRVTGIWMRYGKHKSELNPFGSTGFGKKSSPIEQFHKHACLQLSIGTEGINLGMFHSTANDGVDCGYVDDNWKNVKQLILKEYDKIVGYEFVWTFYSNKENLHKASFDIDKGTATEFVNFYRKYDMAGFESFCMRHYETHDLRIKTYKNILNEVYKTFEAILPLYKAMTFRIPVNQR